MRKNNLFLILLLALIVIAARLLPHLPNFSPLVGVMLFAGVYGQQKKYWLLLLGALFISDIFIGFYQWQIMLTVYGSLLLIALLGSQMRQYKNILNISTSALGSALLFFLSTNLAVWYFGNWYSHNLSGLLLCYTLAIPFFKSTLISTIVYSSLLFGLYESPGYLIKEKKLSTNK